jgi:succinyl-diaminopimelate desuccinylase
LTDLVETAAWLVDIPSVTGDEAGLRDAIAERLQGMPQHAIADSLVVGQPGDGTVMLVGHLDTVPLQGEVGAILEGDRLHGLGATDMKGGLAVMIHLAEALGPEKVSCVFYAGEEGPLPGNQLSRVLEEAPWLARSSGAVVLEPTDRAIEAGCQGVINADVVFIGRPAHSARPWLGENAITKSSEFLAFLGAMEPEPHVVNGLEFLEVMSVTGAHGGVARNVIPGEFVMNINYRFAPDRSHDAAVARLHEVCAPADRVEVTDLAPAGSVDTDHPLFQALIENTAAPLRAKQGWTDVAQLSSAGVPAVNFGPGEPSLAHKPGESVRVSDLAWAYESLLDLLR